MTQRMASLDNGAFQEAVCNDVVAASQSYRLCTIPLKLYLLCSSIRLEFNSASESAMSIEHLSLTFIDLGATAFKNQFHYELSHRD
jgi:hypothetical protein